MERENDRLENNQEQAFDIGSTHRDSGMFRSRDDLQSHWPQDQQGPDDCLQGGEETHHGQGSKLCQTQ